ncbi:MAG: manganese efflux pump MntP family protein [Oscillospiraceae bacterium]|nr:manganese efflux pump MntP family protein [Oscillospiraceae bacterium]
MDILSLLGIAVGLSMDAFAVSIANGAACKTLRPAFALKLGIAFGLFQALMPMIGWLIGWVGEVIITSVDHWIALLLLGFLGVKMIWEAVRHKDEETESRDDIPLRTLLVLAIATSIDALATGILLPSAVGAANVWLMLLSVAIIGCVTFCFCVPGAYIGKKFGNLLSSKAEIFGGAVLIAIGIKIFVEHMFFS